MNILKVSEWMRVNGAGLLIEATQIQFEAQIGVDKPSMFLARIEQRFTRISSPGSDCATVLTVYRLNEEDDFGAWVLLQFFEGSSLQQFVDAVGIVRALARGNCVEGVGGVLESLRENQELVFEVAV